MKARLKIPVHINGWKEFSLAFIFYTLTFNETKNFN